MRRRDFVALFGGAAWPLPLRAQQAAMPVIGFLNGFSASTWSSQVTAFHKGLSEAGYVEGRNVTIEYLWAESQIDRLPALAAEFVRQQVNVLVATGGSATALAAKTATSTIPIVFAIGGDPVAMGLVANLGRPGGNATGIYFLTSALEPKRVGLLRDLVPKAALIGVLFNPTMAVASAQTKDVEDAARSVGQRIHIVRATSEREIDTAFATFAQMGAGALLIGADPFFLTRRAYIVSLAARYAMPAIYEQREFALVGGLMTYGTNLTEATRQAGSYTGRILKGAKPAELPVLQPTQFELVVNLKTAKALGLTISDAMLAVVDEVIE